MLTTKKTASKKKAKKVGRPLGATRQFNFSLTAEIHDIINRKGRFTHQREIVSALAKKAGKVEDPIAFARKTSVLLYNQKQTERIAQYSVSDSTRDKYYGLPEWVNKKSRKPVSGKEPKLA